MTWSRLLPAVSVLDVAVRGGEIDPTVRDNDGLDHPFADVPAGVGRCVGLGRGSAMTDTTPQPSSGHSWQDRVAPVECDTAAAQATYYRSAGVYDLVEAPFERRARAVGLRLLAARPGERVLEVGPGTGHTLVTLAGEVGPRGFVVGADLSARMAARARRRLVHAGYGGRTGVVRGQAHRLPIGAGAVDAVTMSSVLDLIDTEQIPPVLAECRRVLRPDGRLAVVARDLVDRPPAMAGSTCGGSAACPSCWTAGRFRSPTCSPPPAGRSTPYATCPLWACPSQRRWPRSPTPPKAASTGLRTRTTTTTIQPQMKRRIDEQATSASKPAGLGRTGCGLAGRGIAGRGVDR
jgi:SAM-dependent methyltransferase